MGLENVAVPTAPRVLFLPGAGGDQKFWSPVTRRLPCSWEKLALSWPGLGEQPHDPNVRGIDDLAALVVAALTSPSDLVAQSIGGVVAVRVAARYPELVRRVVLVATSGGIELATDDAQEWRDEYRRSYPGAVSWITDPVSDQRPMLAAIKAPTLLLWGDRDPISPISVGSEFARLLPNATMRVIAGATHSFAFDHPEIGAPLIGEHLR